MTVPVFFPFRVLSSLKSWCITLLYEAAKKALYALYVISVIRYIAFTRQRV